MKLKKRIAGLVLTLLCMHPLFAQFSTEEQAQIDSLKTALKTAKHDTTRCEILNQLIENESDDEIWPTYNNQMKVIAEKNLNANPTPVLKLKFSNYLAAAFNNIAYLAVNQGDFNKGIKGNLESIKILILIQNFPEVALAFISLGHLYKVQGDYTKAIELYKKALRLSSQIKDRKGESNALFFIGEIVFNQGNMSESLEYYLKSLKIREAIADKAGTAYCFNNIALIYEKQNELDKAIDYNRKSLELNIKLNDKYATATALNNIGLCYLKKEDLKKAEEFYNKSLKVYEEINDDRSIAYVYINLGSVFQKQHDLEKALLYYNKSLKIRTKAADKSGVAQCLIHIANVYFLQGKVIDAETNAVTGLKMAKEIGYPDKILSAANILYKIYEKQNKGMEAFQMHKLYVVMRDSITNLSNQKALITQNTKYEYEKKVMADSVRIAEEKKVTNAQLKQEKTQRFALYGTILLVGLFGVFMFSRLKITKKQNSIIHKQKSVIEEKHKEITDSINYAERIQRSFLATKELLDENLTEYFVFFKPKDIVSGDFYWASKLNNGNFALVTADSTGHGVPGSIMSLLNSMSLEKAIETHTEPSEILNASRRIIIDRLKKDGTAEGGKDGMDASITVYDFAHNKLIVAAANNPVWIIRGSHTERSRSVNEGNTYTPKEQGFDSAQPDIELIEIKPDKMPVGKHDKQDVSFTQQEITLQQGDLIYTLTDGFPDQFGGEHSKKFMSKHLKELLLANAHLPMAQQKNVLDTTFANWRGTLEQVDDVCVIGVKI